MRSRVVVAGLAIVGLSGCGSSDPPRVAAEAPADLRFIMRTVPLGAPVFIRA